MHLKQQAAFTLLAMLLLIALIAVGASAGISIFGVNQVAIQVTKTSLQVEQALTASSAFFKKNGIWPPALSDLVSQKYLPANAITTLWGGSIRRVNPGNNTENLMSVTVPLPSHNLAAQVAAQLPNATVYPNVTTGTDVRASVPKPSGGGRATYIVDIQTVNMGNTASQYKVIQSNVPCPVAGMISYPASAIQRTVLKDFSGHYIGGSYGWAFQSGTNYNVYAFVTLLGLKSVGVGQNQRALFLKVCCPSPSCKP